MPSKSTNTTVITILHANGILAYKNNHTIITTDSCDTNKKKYIDIDEYNSYENGVNEGNLSLSERE